MSEAISTSNPPEPQDPSAQEWRRQSDGQHVLAMTDSQFDAFVIQTAKLDSIYNAFGYGERGYAHTTPEERAAITARLLIKNLQGE